MGIKEWLFGARAATDDVGDAGRTVPVGGLIEVPEGKSFDEAYDDWKRNNAQARADTIGQAVAAESEWWIRVPVKTVRHLGLPVMHRGDLWNARWWPTDGYMCEGDLYGAPFEAPT